ncbi:MAG: hypothetical protein V2B18_21215 [Pseudomonadota bacterium]
MMQDTVQRHEENKEVVGGIKSEYRINGCAPCPFCEAPWAPVRNVLPWAGNMRVRYHVCRRCGKSFKSVEVFC